MNKIDKCLYRALKFLSKKSIKNIKEIKKENINKYYKYVPQLVEESLERARFIEDRPEEEYSLVTGRGLQQLRLLEDIRIREKSILISILAIIIALISLIKSMDWI